jgi:hypothetical protein
MEMKLLPDKSSSPLVNDNISSQEKVSRMTKKAHLIETDLGG